MVVVLDEFQQVLELGEAWLEPVFREAIVRRRTRAAMSWVIMGSRHHLLDEAFTAQGRPLFNAAQPFPLEPISTDDLAPFVVDRFRDGGFEIDPDLALRLVERARGKPAYVQQLAHHLFQQASLRGGVPSDLDETVESLIQTLSYVYGMVWSELTRMQRHVLASLVFQGTEEPYAAWRTSSLRTSTSTIQRVLRSLQERGILDRVPDGWEFSDPFFPIWFDRYRR